MVMKKDDLEKVIGGISPFLNEDGTYNIFNQDNNLTNTQEYMKTLNFLNLEYLKKALDPKFAVLHLGVEELLDRKNFVGNHYGSVYQRESHFDFDVLEDNGLLIFKNKNSGLNKIDSGDVFLSCDNKNLRGYGIIDNIDSSFPSKSENLRIFPLSMYEKFEKPISREGIKFERNQRLYFFNNF